MCGDGILSPNNGEECDDGNNIDGDGCSADCKIEVPACPLRTCDPTVGFNGCDISTSYIALDGAVAAGVGQHLCVCRHGFRKSMLQKRCIEAKKSLIFSKSFCGKTNHVRRHD